MTDDKAELRASLRLAMTTIRKLAAHQKVDTTAVLKILGRTLQEAKPEKPEVKRTGFCRL